MDINLLLRGGELNRLLGRPSSEQRLVQNLLQSLQPGQLLLAKVLAQPRADVARLLIQNVALNAFTARALQPGAMVQLSVLKGGPTPELRVLDPQRPANAQDVLRVALPRQLPLADTLAGLRELAPRLLPVLTASSRELFKSVLDNTTDLKNLSHKELKQQVQNSGLFTEAKLAKGQLPDGGDRKLQMMRLAASLPGRAAAAAPQTAASMPATGASPTAQLAKPGEVPVISRAALLGATVENLKAASSQAGNTQLTPEQQAIQRLWRLIDASIARIQTHQAGSLPAEREGRTALQMEIPVNLPGGTLQVIELRIEEEPPREGEDEDAANEAGWLVTIGFQFAELGPVKAGVRLADGRIYTTFWCEQADAVDRFNRMLPQLHRNLESVGLEVGGLAASQGQPPAAQHTPAWSQAQLLDERV